MPSRVPEPLLKQAGAAVSSTRALVDFFEKSGPAQAACGTAVQEELKKAKSLAQAVKAWPCRGREDWLVVSRCLSELADQAGWAVAESGRFRVPNEPSLSAMARGLAETAAEIAAALETLERGAECSAHLVRAKGKALEMERNYRQIRADHHGDVEVVKVLRSGEIYRRLSQALEASQQAADKLGELLGAS